MVSSGYVRSFIPRSGTLSCLLGVLAFLLSSLSTGPDSIATTSRSEPQPIHRKSFSFLAAPPETETEESPIPESVKAQLLRTASYVLPN